MSYSHLSRTLNNSIEHFISNFHYFWRNIICSYWYCTLIYSLDKSNVKFFFFVGQIHNYFSFIDLA